MFTSGCFGFHYYCILYIARYTSIRIENRLLTADFLSDDGDFRKGGDVRADGSLPGVLGILGILQRVHIPYRPEK